MLNKVFLIGNLGKDPEIKSLPSGSCVVNFSMATTEKRNDKSGNKVQFTEWHNISCYNENLLPLFKSGLVSKGALVHVEGSIKTRKYVSNGVNREVKDIIISAITLLKTAGGSDNRSYDNSDDHQNSNNFDNEKMNSQEDSSYNKNAQEKNDSSEGLDDDIPF